MIRFRQMVLDERRADLLDLIRFRFRPIALKNDLILDAFP